MQIGSHFTIHGALLQVKHLLGELRAFQGLVAQRFAGFAVSGLFLRQGALGVLELLAGGLHLDFQGCGRLLVLADLLGVLRLRCCRDSLYDGRLEPRGQQFIACAQRMAAMAVFEFFEAGALEHG